MNPSSTMARQTLPNIKIQEMLRTMAQFQDENQGFVDSWTFDGLLTAYQFKAQDIIELIDGNYIELSILRGMGGENDWVLTQKGHVSFC